MVYIFKIALLLSMTVTTKLDKIEQVLLNQHDYNSKAFQQIEDYIANQSKINSMLQESLAEALKKIKSFETKFIEIDAVMKKQEKEIQSLKQELQVKNKNELMIEEKFKKLEEENSTKSAETQSSHAESNTTITKELTSIWGQGNDSSNETIARVYTFAASRIPNQENYSCDWFKSQTQKLFASNKHQVEILRVERIPSYYPSARTKSFKFLLKTKENLAANDLLQPNNWIRGLKIARFRRPPPPVSRGLLPIWEQ